MTLGSLRVIHLLKEGGVAQAIEAPGAFVLDSCQRYLWIDAIEMPSQVAEQNPAVEVYVGIEAYAFLLSVSTGLASQVIGETDIFGQLKEAWKTQARKIDPKLKKDLSPWMQRLFEDTKEIRSQYLQNLGGSSYGSLLRKLLKDHESLERSPTLLIGAGQLARSVAPYLLDHELLISNRTTERAHELALDLQQQNPSARIRVLETFEEELAAIGNAAQVIVCVPLDSKRDQVRVEHLHRSSSHVVHLGARALEATSWNKLSAFHSLDELFQIEKSISAIRFLQVKKAVVACREKAMLRFLGGASSSIAHGWEDLAAFGS
jgi:hypothetical protein